MHKLMVNADIQNLAYSLPLLYVGPIDSVRAALLYGFSAFSCDFFVDRSETERTNQV